MPNIFCVEKAKKSSVKRLSFLPRFGIVIDFGGRQLAYRQAPFLETLVNMRKSGFSFKNLVDVSLQQLKEITLPDQTEVAKAARPQKKKRKKK